MSASPPTPPTSSVLRIADLSLLTVLIENEWHEAGTGFLVGRQRGASTDKVFLVTNKHVLNRDPNLRKRATAITLFMNDTQLDGTIVSWTTRHQLRYTDGTANWKEHPDKDVDVLVIDVTGLLVQRPSLARKYMDYSLFVTPEVRRKLAIGAGDEVVLLGYPLGLRHRSTNFPLVRFGMIATRIGEELEDDVPDGTVTRKRILRGFLYDGGSIPGSSGSPVFLRPTDTRYLNGAIVAGPVVPYLLGIVAETRYAPISTPTGVNLSFAGLGLAFDAETIKETIEQFFPR